MLKKFYSILGIYHLNQFGKKKPKIIDTLKGKTSFGSPSYPELKKMGLIHLCKAQDFFILCNDRKRSFDTADTLYSLALINFNGSGGGYTTALCQEAYKLYMQIEDNEGLLKIANIFVKIIHQGINRLGDHHLELIFDYIVPAYERTGEIKKISSLLSKIVITGDIEYSHPNYEKYFGNIYSRIGKYSTDYLFEYFNRLKNEDSHGIINKCRIMAGTLIDIHGQNVDNSVVEYLYQDSKRENNAIKFVLYDASYLSKVKDRRILSFLKQYWAVDDYSEKFIKECLKQFGLDFPPKAKFSKPMPSCPKKLLYVCKFFNADYCSDDETTTMKCLKKSITTIADPRGQYQSEPICNGCSDYELGSFSYNACQALSEGRFPDRILNKFFTFVIF